MYKWYNKKYNIYGIIYNINGIIYKWYNKKIFLLPCHVSNDSTGQDMTWHDMTQ